MERWKHPSGMEGRLLFTDNYDHGVVEWELNTKNDKWWIAGQPEKTQELAIAAAARVLTALGFTREVE